MKMILIIDQEKNTTFTLQKLLESESFNVFSAYSLEEALDILNARKFDLIVVSRDLPSGQEGDVVRWLCRHVPQTHIITLSSTDSPGAPDLDVLAEYVKPLDYYSLVQTIKTSMASKGFSGILSDIGLLEYIQMFCMNSSTKAVLVTQGNAKGIILLSDGHVVYAVQDALKGEEAFYRIMSWKKGTLKEVKIKKFPEPNINKDINLLLMEGASRATLTQTIEAPLEGNKEVPKPAIQGKSSLGEREIGPEVSASAGGGAQAAANAPPAVVKPKRSWLKIAMAAILPLLVVLIGINSFFSYSGNSDVAVRQEQTSVVAAALQTSPVQAKTEVVPAKKAETPPVPDSAIEVTPPQPAAQTVDIPETVILRLHGSNTIGAKLAPALAQSFMQEIRKAPKVETVPGNANEVRVKAIYGDRVEIIEIQAHGSTTGFEGLAGKKCDIAMSSRKIKTAEVEQLKALGDMTAITNEHVIALDGVAVIVNKSNSLQKLEAQKLADIFTGKISDWSAVQEKAGPVTIYSRDEKSGTFDTFKSIVLGKSDLKANAQLFESNPELSDKVAMDPAGIGFTSLPNIRNAKGLAIAEQGAGAIFPNFFTVATEDYPLSRRLYLYTETNPSQPLVREFVEYVHSRSGQMLVKDLGFVDLNIKSFVAEGIDSASLKDGGLARKYAETVHDAERLSLNFRFKNNLAVLDNRGMRDLDRMIDYLKETTGKKIILAGFADNSGDYEYNRTLALERAETVAQELRSRGIAISTVLSAGEELPVASNTTDQGKEKNRRVEVWVR